MTDFNNTVGSLEKFDANWIDRKLPKSTEEFLAILEADIVGAFDEIEVLSEEELTNNAIRLTALVRIYLRQAAEYDVNTLALPSGNAQINVKDLRSTLEWVGIGAVARSVEDVHKSYRELLNTRPPAWPNQDGALILFANRNNGLVISSEWRDCVLKMPCEISTCQLRPMQFKSASVSATNGTPFRVWHTFMQLPTGLQFAHAPVSSNVGTADSSTLASPVQRQSRRTHSIVLIHGIRTQAEWQHRVAAILEADPSIRVVPTRFGFLDVVRFLIPSAAVRREPVNRITKLIRDELSRKPEKLPDAVHRPR